ncbi:MAG: cytochrome P450 [bacterium]
MTSSLLPLSPGNDSLLTRFSQTSFGPAVSGLSTAQAHVDCYVSSFVEQASDFTSVAAMTLGGLACRLGRLGTLSLVEGLPARSLVRLISHGVGLASEVTAFETSQRGLRHLTGDASHLQQGFWDGWRSSFVNFGILKLGGAAAQGQNLFVRHFIQDGAMVAGNQFTARLGWTPAPRGDWAEQFLHAEVLNLQTGAALSFAHACSPGLYGLERGLDLSLQALDSSGLFFSHAFSRVQPAFAVAEISRGFFAPEGRGIEPRIEGPTVVMMTGAGDGNGGGRNRGLNGRSSPSRETTSSASGSSAPPAPSPKLQLHVASPEVPGPARRIPTLATLQFVKDPVSFGLEHRPVSGSGVVGVAKGSGGMVVVYGAELAREVLTDMATWLKPSNALVRPPEDPRLAAIFTSILRRNGAEWQRARRVLVPPMTQRAVMERMPAIFEETVAEKTGNWRSGETVDLSSVTNAITLRNLMRSLMGLEDPVRGERLASLMDSIAAGGTSPAVALVQRLSFGRVLPGTNVARWVKNAERLRSDLDALIDYKREHPSPDALGALVATVDADTGRTLTNDELVGELAAFYAAGYHTTAHTLTWTLWALAHHPQIGERASQEVRDVLQGRAPTYADIPRLNFLNDVVREAQRLFSIVPATLPRTTVREARLGGVRLAPGSNVTVSIVGQHHNPAIFPDPGRFDPGRWAELDAANRNLAYDFLPFGAGPRRCLGGVFADLQIRATLALLLQRHAFVPMNRPVNYRVQTFAMGPDGALPMALVPPGEWRENRPPTGTITRLLHL